MMFIFTVFTLFFLPISSLKEIKPKLCIQCKYFITDKRDGKYGKCALFPKNKNDDVFDLVTGVEINKEYMYCYTTRASEALCGKEGTMYKKKKKAE